MTLKPAAARVQAALDRLGLSRRVMDFQYDLIYAAAGVPECVFPLTPGELQATTGATVGDVRVDRGASV